MRTDPASRPAAIRSTRVCSAESFWLIAYTPSGQDASGVSYPPGASAAASGNGRPSAPACSRRTAT
jgi:hypothetical protein